MAQANQSDFLEGTGGTVDPFTGLAPALSPEEEARQRLLKLGYNQTQTRNINQLGNDQSAATSGDSYSSVRGRSDRSSQFHANPSQVIDAYVYGKTDPDGNRISQEEYEAAKALQKGNHDAMNTGAYKALTYGILGIPAAVTGGALAAGGPQMLGFGLGEGSIAGGSATPLALQGTDTAAAEGVMNAAHVATPGGVPVGTPFSMASPSVAGATGGAASAAGGAAGFAKNIAVPALSAIAPLAIQQATKGPTREQKQLMELQRQLALQAQQRQGQIQDERMNQLGQQVLAFNPRNQMLAQMYGPQAAFTPEQMATMVQGQEPSMDPNILNYAGNDQGILRQKQEMIRRHNEWLKAESQRRDMVMNNFQAPGAGPAPINMPAPQAARRF